MDGVNKEFFYIIIVTRNLLARKVHSNCWPLVCLIVAGVNSGPKEGPCPANDAKGIKCGFYS